LETDLAPEPSLRERLVTLFERTGSLLGSAAIWSSVFGVLIACASMLATAPIAAGALGGWEDYLGLAGLMLELVFTVALVSVLLDRLGSRPVTASRLIGSLRSSWRVFYTLVELLLVASPVLLLAGVVAVLGVAGATAVLGDPGQVVLIPAGLILLFAAAPFGLLVPVTVSDRDRGWPMISHTLRMVRSDFPLAALALGVTGLITTDLEITAQAVAPAISPIVSAVIFAAATVLTAGLVCVLFDGFKREEDAKAAEIAQAEAEAIAREKAEKEAEEKLLPHERDDMGWSR
jgi:hypothetical protein